MKWKHNLILIFLLLAGVVVGSLLASATAGMPFLGWLSYGGRVGISTQEPKIGRASCRERVSSPV